MKVAWWIIALAAAATGVVVWLIQLTGATPPAGLDALGQPIESTTAAIRDTTLALGLTLLGAYLAGKAAAAVGLAKITGFLVFGAVVGPSTLGLISHDTLPKLQLANGLAISLIALTAGGEIELSFIKKQLKSISIVLGAEMVAVGIAITAAAYFILTQTGILEGATTPTIVLISAIVAVVMIANSPAVAIAIISETRARGPMAQTVLAVSVLKDLVLIILFALITTLTLSNLSHYDPARIGQPQSVDQVVTEQNQGLDAEDQQFVAEEDGSELAEQVVQDASTQQPKKPKSATWKIGGSLLFGLLIGALLAFYVKFINAHMAFFIVGSAFAIALISQEISVEPLIVALTAGLVMRNMFESSSGSFFHALEDLSFPVYTLFFAVAGAKIEWGPLAEIAHYVALLLAVRYVAVWAGTTLGTKLAGIEKPAQTWIWTGFIPQAGVSLALAIVVRDTFPDWSFGPFLFALLLSTIALNELVGPILFKFGLAKAGETHTDPSTSSSENPQ